MKINQKSWALAVPSVSDDSKVVNNKTSSACTNESFYVDALKKVIGGILFKTFSIVSIGISLVINSLVAQNIPYAGGRIAISSDGNEHDKDDWAATPFSLALLAAKGLQDNLVLYTFSDHVWGSNHDNKNAVNEMRESALVGGQKFGFTKTNFIEAVANPNAAYEAMTSEINKSSASNPLTIIAAGPMQVVGTALNNADQSKLAYVRIISHSTWNDNHSDKPSSWERHTGWT